MLAPQTIQVRYGPTGLLAGTLGTLLGRNEAFQRQSALDQNFINNRLDYAAQQQQQADAMNANALQQAHQQFAQPQQPQQPQVQNPADYAVNQAYLTGAAHDISPESQDALSALTNKPGVKPSEFGALLGSNVASQQKRKTEEDAQATLSQKRAFLKAAAPTLDPNDINSLAAASEDPRFSMNQLALAVSGLQRGKQQQIKNEKAAQDKQNATAIAQSRADTDEQMKRMAVEVARREKLLREAGVDPENPSSLNPQYQPGTVALPSILGGRSAPNPNAGVLVNLPESNVDFRPDTSKANLFKSYIQAKNAYEFLKNSKEQTQPVGRGMAAPAGNSQVGKVQNSGPQIGQIIQTPRGLVKITGFDTDGHPLADPVQ